MKRSPESRTTADTMPSFLDETTSQTEELTPTGDESTMVEAEDSPAVEPDDTAEASGPARPQIQVAGTRRKANLRPAAPPAKAHGTLAIAFGATLVLGSVALGVLQSKADSTSALGRMNLQPSTLTVLGAVLLAAGTTRRSIGAMQQRLEATDGQQTNGTDSLRESLQFLVDAQHANNERPPAAGEELQHVLVSMQRQDEKINNLTKAIKMYGKPLMEISGQGTEMAGSVGQVKTAVEVGLEATKQAFARLETQLRSTSSKQEVADLHEAIGRITAAVAAIEGKPGESMSLEPLQQQVARVEVTLAALSQRLEDNEVRKSLVRLEDATQKAREEVQVLMRGEGVQKVATQLQDRLDKATSRLSDGIQQMRDGNLSGLETAVRDIQREITGVATTVAQIQVAVKSGSRGTTASAPAMAPATATPVTATQAASPPTPTAEKPATPAAEATGGYQTGTRSSTGKNVLGAIAKLKQMKN